MNQLVTFSSTNSTGCPKQHLSKQPTSTVDLFPLRSLALASKSLPPPSFLVPAIIDGLKNSRSYGHLVHLVPGEADAYCARHVAENGGLILTSDSDLLAHDLKDGRVAFLRDIRMESRSDLACATFAPTQICERLGLGPELACRLAYERKCSTNASLAQLVSYCKQPVNDETGYETFCRQYLHLEIRKLPVTKQGKPLRLDCFDPRISEFMLQLDEPQGHPKSDQLSPKIFLPHLIESPEKGSAWEPSTPIRQLAYSVARMVVPGFTRSVQEYRRVQNTVQKGREVTLMNESSAEEFASWISDVISEVKAILGDDVSLFWPLLCLVCDISQCQKQEKQSHVLQTLRDAPVVPLGSSKVPWGVVHFAAHLQAAYYSFRTLHQVLSSGSGLVSEISSPKILSLNSSLSGLPSLATYPDVDSALDMISQTQRHVVIQVLETCVQTDPGLGLNPHYISKADGRRRKRKKTRKDISRSSRGAPKPKPTNSFDVLALETSNDSDQ